MIIGLTGGIGSGKTTVTKFFSEFEKVAIYIADVEAKNLMNSSETIKEKLIIEFGKSAFIDQKLNRKYISEIVFKDAEKLASLNAIVHPEVKNHFKISFFFASLFGLYRLSNRVLFTFLTAGFLGISL